MANLTDMENKTLQFMKGYLRDYEDSFSDLDIETLSVEVEIPIKQLRGVLGSLIKKEIIYTEDIDINGVPKVFYYLEN